MRNTLCLFRTDGTASCAYVYPFMCNGVKGQLYDGWANDQDYALFFAMVNGFFDACSIDIEITGVDTVEKITVPDDVKKNAVETTSLN